MLFKFCGSVRLIFIFFIICSVFILDQNAVAEPEIVRIKLATLAPPGTTSSIYVEGSQQALTYLGKRIGFRTKVIGYYGGVMGNDPQMVQKGRIGQLDMLLLTLTGLTVIAEQLEVFNLAFLFDDFGQFDYVMKKNSSYINSLLYTKGWISLGLINPEGYHELYIKKPYKTISEFRTNIKAVNYTGGPDETFFGALKIPQSILEPTEMYSAFRTGTFNAAILPAAFTIGMQIYTTLSYIVDPPIRIPTSAILLTRNIWEKLPLYFRIYFAMTQPLIYYFAGYTMRDAGAAYSAAIYKYGCKSVKLDQSEVLSMKEKVTAYREQYVKSSGSKRELYNRINAALNEYKESNPPEKAIYEKDPQYKHVAGNIIKIKNALEYYYMNGSKSRILQLSKDNIIEKWRLYDWITACENYITTGKDTELKKWFDSFHAGELSEEYFTKNPDAIKKLYGSKSALRDRIEELVALLNMIKGYNGYQTIPMR